MKYRAIAIDGPAGAGKSTMARKIAKALDYVYVDTGAIYRTVGYHMDLMGIGPKDIDGITRLLDDVNLEITYDAAGEQHMILNGVDVSGEIRTPEMSKISSIISSHKIVRDFLLDTQRDVAKLYNTVMDGRDIGTVVLPQADLKIYLTASPEVRAHRRYEQHRQAGKNEDEKTILKEIIDRDYRDSHRTVAPLRPAKDAITVDTSEMDEEQTLAYLLSLAEQKLR